jgi:flagellar biosynthesis protein FlhB
VAENQQEDRSRDDLTEEASPYRIEEMRRRGQVAQSREVTGLLALFAAAITAYVLSPRMGAELADFMRETFRTDLSARIDLGGTHVMQGIFFKALRILAVVALPVCIAGFVFGVAGSLGQVGSIFSTDPISPDFEKINPLAGIKRMFSKRQMLEAVRTVVKMTIIIAVSYGLVKSQILGSGAQLDREPGGLIPIYAGAAKGIFVSLLSVLTLFAALDWWLTRREFQTSAKMTKQEAKQEHKEREGDPQIKARIRAVQREIARRRMMAAVKKADVIITNPTHIAIAIVYNRDAMLAPKVVAKGADLIAQRIKKIAADAGVPLVENVPLARTLFKTVKVNQYVPRALYQAVAEVLAYVYRLKSRGF